MRFNFFMPRPRRLLLPTTVLAAGLLLFSCHQEQTGTDTSSDFSGVASDSSRIQLHPQYARGFEITYRNGYALLSLHDPQQEKGTVTQFALVPRGTRPKITEKCELIEVPLRSVICMTSLQLSNFIALEQTGRVKGITSTRHLRNARMREQLRNGTTHKIGIEGNFDNEVIMSIAPDAIFISPYKRGGYDALRDVGTPLIPHFGYKETTPLGQAEWIKCIGVLTGCEQQADSLFNAIAEHYRQLCELASAVTERPVVFSGEMQGGHWYAVGGRSFLAELFRDAGADYFLKDDTRSGGVTLDFEEVYSIAATADYWRILNSYDGVFDYEALKAEDARYADFHAWKSHGVLYCNQREVPFYESTPVQPDIVLADLIKAFHPELLPDHEPQFYKLLK